MSSTKRSPIARPRPRAIARRPLPSRIESVARPVADPRVFLAGARRRIAALSVVFFGAFFGLSAVDVVGVTAHAGALGSTAAGTGAGTPALVLPPGDFFGLPGSQAGVGQAYQQPIILGGGQPMLSSGGS